jgi:hypothetical protein
MLNPLAPVNTRRPFSFRRTAGDSLLSGFVGAWLPGNCG